MINLILFGPPGSGKGTQAEFIVHQKKLKHISTGDVFRKNITQKTNLGTLASSYMNKGQLVPDSLTINLLEQELDSSLDSNGFIFDGFPRTIKQADALDLMLMNKKMPLSLVIMLEVGEQELVNRLLKRGADSGREDDKNEKIIRNRIQVYEKQTSILKSYYNNKLKSNFFILNGERTVLDISNEISSILSNLK
tara:strand:- start:20 stop:601 length:582 start_codon:yes stop_codon:yes gene_type:complete